MKNSRTTLPPSDVVQGMMFAGNCGVSNALRCLAWASPKKWPHWKILILNSDASQLREFITGKLGELDFSEKEKKNLSAWISLMNEKNGQLTVLGLGPDGRGAGGNPEKAAAYVTEKADKIKKWMKSVDIVIILGGFGKGTGTGSIPLLQRWAKKLGKYPFTIATMPFSDDGRVQSVRANNALKSVLPVGIIWAIHNDNIPKEFLEEGSDITLGELYDVINRKSTLPVLSALREIALVVGHPENSDINDWKTLMSLGNVAICYFAEMEQSSSKTPETIEVFVEKLITGNPYQDLVHKREIEGIHYWFHGKWTLREMKAVASAVTKDIGKEASEKLATFRGVHHGTDGKKWAIAVCAANVPIEEVHTGNSPAATTLGGDGKPDEQGKGFTIYAYTDYAKAEQSELTLKSKELYLQWTLYNSGKWPESVNGKPISSEERMMAFADLAERIEKETGHKPVSTVASK
jgi:cell division GTPase FtsZ